MFGHTTHSSACLQGLNIYRAPTTCVSVTSGSCLSLRHSVALVKDGWMHCMVRGAGKAMMRSWSLVASAASSQSACRSALAGTAMLVDATAYL